MRVLILANFGMGLYNFRRELIERLLEEEYEVYISSPVDKYITKFESMGCKIVDTSVSRRGKNPVTDIRLILHYKKIIREINPNVVLTYTIKPNVYGGIACSLLDVPYIANITGLGTAVENGGLMQKITTMLYKFSLKKVNTLFFQNEENMNFFKRNRIATNKHILLPGSGVNLDYFRILDYPVQKTVDFVFISRIMKQKGIDEYLETAKFIRDKYPQTRFHVCGFNEENYKNKLDEYQKKGIIINHNIIEDIREILKDIHCTIHPSYYPEGMSNVLLESAAAGRPIITTNRSGCREIVDDKVNGFIVEQENSQDLIAKVEQFLELDFEAQKSMGVSGRRKAEKEFDRKIIVNMYLNMIGKIK
ncbi:galacturonosyl transferase [Oceanobacillus iheyensis HTE831]|uniref:Galacturonosyl transferase n=1 Tax=Oceanobacillus iheyensis (strain DSM 14371 / CIP 107618 / JCM 11309 / KCTC 3954 / HTE831) TaxID=221109 RepID=Q8EMF7_OCEIH|nr:glycosyltransferase family 4 protein [Oceanobacillus iheyensis]BAC14846.1 galacturonosyl transferase [Oceanobacillus iheyensis HTE831]